MSVRILFSLLVAAVASFQLAGCGGASAAEPLQTTAQSCGTFESWVGQGKINVVDFTAQTGGASSPFRFRLKFHEFKAAGSDGYFGPLTTGTMTFSYPRKNNPEVPYVKEAPYPAPYLDGPAFGEKISYQAREVACNVFELHWKEPNKGDTVTHVEDFNRQHVCTNITNINRVAIAPAFDPFDLGKQLNNPAVAPGGSPVSDSNFGWFNLCGTMKQSLESDKVWENQLHYLVYTAP